ncbi:acyl-CoA dehydrogenase family protein [Svornostia abyssi]|uniref:Acyl-CoA dehydrogenase family protein n=1 Tax=Svornostia abyssi TaxID=2898438 RepID=A0ABY5PJ48_9ACTN|nr:acyl-CoA dehydrogenase family protein [Parviterribacteraceae bacterium J379]
MATTAQHMGVSADAAPSIPLVPSDEELELRAAVRGICEAVKAGSGHGADEHKEVQTRLIAALAEHGFNAPNIAEEWGGGGLGITGLVPIVEEIHAAGHIAASQVLSASIVGSLLEHYGTPGQQEEWLRPITAGTKTLAFGITEPDAGSNTHKLRTELRRDGDGYRLKGQKVFTSTAGESDAILVVARFRGEDGKLGLPGLAIVDGGAEGLSMDEIPVPGWPEKTYQTFYDDIRVEADQLIGGEEAGLAALFHGLNPERICAAAGGCGWARRAIEIGTSYAKERVVWKEPIGAHQAIAHPLAEAQIQYDLALLMTRKAAALADAGAPEAGYASNVAKFAAAKAANFALDRAIQTHGGNGVTEEYGLTEFWWPVRTLRIAPVSEEMILNNVAQHTLGLPRSY